MTQLVDLSPAWIHEHVFTFKCPHCRAVWLTCKDAILTTKQQREIIDKHFGEEMGHEVVGCRVEVCWQIDGRDFASMTVHPSLDASASGHWHGFIRGGKCDG